MPGTLYASLLETTLTLVLVSESLQHVPRQNSKLEFSQGVFLLNLKKSDSFDRILITIIFKIIAFHRPRRRDRRQSSLKSERLLLVLLEQVLASTNLYLRMSDVLVVLEYYY